MGRGWRSSAALFVALFVIVGDRAGHRPPERALGRRRRGRGRARRRHHPGGLRRRPAADGRGQGLPKAPPPSSPQYPTLRDAAMSATCCWRAGCAGEAAERGITRLRHRDREPAQADHQQQFGGQKEFQQFLKQAGFTPQQARGQVELTLLSTQIQEQVLPHSRRASRTREIEDFYDANKAQFTSPRRATCARSSTRTRPRSSRPRRSGEGRLGRELEEGRREVLDRPGHQGDRRPSRRASPRARASRPLDAQIFSAAQGAARRPVQGPGGLLPDRGRQGHPGGDDAALEGQRPDQAAARQGLQQEIGHELPDQTSSTSGPRGPSAPTATWCRAPTSPPPDPARRRPGEPGDLDKRCTRPCPRPRRSRPGSATVFPGQPAQARPQGPLSRPAAKQRARA